MKKSLALAGGDHVGGHGMRGGHDMTQMSHEVMMDDNMRFTPDQIKVKAGETVRFLVRNAGKIQHEMVIGPMAELKEHAATMRTQPKMKHAEPNTVSLDPGQRGGIVWRFDKAGSVDFACLLPGHLEAGMVGRIAVE